MYKSQISAIYQAQLFFLHDGNLQVKQSYQTNSDLQYKTPLKNTNLIILWHNLSISLCRQTLPYINLQK